MTDRKISRTVRHEDYRRLEIGLEPEILETALVGYGWKNEKRPQMPARTAKLSVRQTIKDGKPGPVVVVLYTDRLKKDGQPAKTGDNHWELPEQRDWLWSIKRTFTDEAIDRLFELRAYAIKEWEAIDWEKVEAS